MNFGQTIFSQLMDFTPAHDYKAGMHLMAPDCLYRIGEQSPSPKDAIPRGRCCEVHTPLNTKRLHIQLHRKEMLISAL